MAITKKVLQLMRCARLVGVTQVEMAKMLGTSQPAVSMALKGSDGLSEKHPLEEVLLQSKADVVNLFTKCIEEAKNEQKRINKFLQDLTNGVEQPVRPEPTEPANG